MNALDSSLLLSLTAPRLRLPGLEIWLRNEVWNDAAFDRAGRSPKDYLLAGERLVNERESLLATTAPQVYSELTTVAVPDRTVSAFFANTPRSAAVVFDGCSLRELPRPGGSCGRVAARRGCRAAAAAPQCLRTQHNSLLTGSASDFRRSRPLRSPRGANCASATCATTTLGRRQPITPSRTDRRRNRRLVPLPGPAVPGQHCGR